MNILLATLLGVSIYAVLITIVLLVLRRNADTERAEPSDEVRLDSIRGALELADREVSQRPRVRAIS